MTKKASPQLTIADVFISDELDRRAPKKTDYLQEKLALQDVALGMADRPKEVLPKFVDLALKMTGGVSAGLGLYEADPAPGVIRWQYLRGELASFDGVTTPRDFSPCGIALDRNAPVLSSHPERVYNWIADANIVIPEVLLVPLWIKTDPNQLEMALLNLMVNARDAMPEGGPIVVAARSVAVSQHEQLRPGSYVCLSVMDSGEGMDEATLSKAVDPFFTTKGVGKGTGLGLPMVHGLAQESGGALVLKSRKGKGTTAELWFPAVKKPSVAATVREVPTRAAGIGRKLTVLVVDDDPLVLTNMAAMLDDLGHTAYEASSALEALSILERESAVELVLTDQAMPEMTGAELILEIKNRWPKLPVILATGFGELPPSIDPLQQITLRKPFRQYDLERALKTALEAPEARRVERTRGRGSYCA